ERSRAMEVSGRIPTCLKKAPPHMEALKVNEIIREVLTLTGNELVRGSTSAQTELEADIPAVLGDRVQLQQVLVNLIMNAIEAMSNTDRPRNVLIRSAKHPMGVLVQVQDSGKGLDPA